MRDEIETPKRRGRPPGSKNRTTVGYRHREYEPAVDGANAEAVVVPPRRIFIRWKVALGQPGEELEVDWPDSWPLPQPGDMIQWGDKMAGFLSHTIYDLPAGRIFLQVR